MNNQLGYAMLTSVYLKIYRSQAFMNYNFYAQDSMHAKPF